MDQIDSKIENINQRHQRKGRESFPEMCSKGYKTLQVTRRLVEAVPSPRRPKLVKENNLSVTKLVNSPDYTASHEQRQAQSIATTKEPQLTDQNAEKNLEQ